MRTIFTAARQRLGGAKVVRRVYRRLPSGKRCKECLIPFLGVFSVPFRLVNIRPSRKNPHLCTL
jgi:ribosomal protein L34E